MIDVFNGFSKRLPWPPRRKIGAVCLPAGAPEWFESKGTL